MEMNSSYIVVIGPDGSGKSTIADRISSLLSKGNGVIRLDFSFGILPPISRVLKRRAKRPRITEGTFMSGMVTPLSPAKAALVGIWYGIDHVLGHLSLISARRHGKMLIFARSYHDFLYQRAYDRIPRIIPHAFLALGPRPDLIACLYRDPELIHANKPELTVQEIQDQYRRIESGLSSLRDFHLIDATSGIDDTVEKLLSLSSNKSINKI